MIDNVNSFQYPFSGAYPLEEGNVYVWQVKKTMPTTAGEQELLPTQVGARRVPLVPPRVQLPLAEGRVQRAQARPGRRRLVVRLRQPAEGDAHAQGVGAGGRAPREEAPHQSLAGHPHRAYPLKNTDRGTP